MRVKEVDLPSYHRAVWTSLTLLGEGERMTGPVLMEHTGIKDRRHLYDIIRDLRHWGYPVGGSKRPEDRGYYIISNDHENEITQRSLLDPAKDLELTARLVNEAYQQFKKEREQSA